MKTCVILFGLLLGLACKPYRGDPAMRDTFSQEVDAGEEAAQSFSLTGQEKSGTPDPRACDKLPSWVRPLLQNTLSASFSAVEGEIALDMPICNFSGSGIKVLVTDLSFATDLAAQNECFFKSSDYPFVRVWKSGRDHCFGIGVFQNGQFDRGRSDQLAQALSQQMENEAAD